MSDDSTIPADEVGAIEDLRKEIDSLKKQLADAQEDKELKKIREVVTEEIKQFKQEKHQIDLKEAHEVYQQAVENERLALSEREEKVNQLQDLKIEREKKDLVLLIKQLRNFLDNRQYPMEIFSVSNTNFQVEQLRQRCYALCRFVGDDPAEFIDWYLERRKVDMKRL